MIYTLKKSLRQELEEFDLLPMNKANYRYSWTYSFDHIIKMDKVNPVSSFEPVW